MATDMAQLEALFLALGDRTRLRLLSLMAAGPVSVSHLVDVTGESQPKVSRHLANLRNYGIVTTERKGKQVFYGVDLSSDTQSTHMLAAVLSSLTGNEAPSRPHRQERRPQRTEKPVVETDTYVHADILEAESRHISYDEEAGSRTEWKPEEGEMDVFLL